MISCIFLKRGLYLDMCLIQKVPYISKNRIDDGSIHEKKYVKILIQNTTANTTIRKNIILMTKYTIRYAKYFHTSIIIIIFYAVIKQLSYTYPIVSI